MLHRIELGKTERRGCLVRQRSTISACTIRGWQASPTYLPACLFTSSPGQKRVEATPLFIFLLLNWALVLLYTHILPYFCTSENAVYEIDIWFAYSWLFVSSWRNKLSNQTYFFTYKYCIWTIWTNLTLFLTFHAAYLFYLLKVIYHFLMASADL
jgi:hypothetical protein